MKSLFIVGFPKGCTSLVYAVCLRATGMRAPAASDGEVLNPDRNRVADRIPMFSDNDESYRKIERRLSEFARSTGFVIKDVLQPFAVARYAKEHRGDFNYLFVDRNPRHVAICQKRAGWDCPDPKSYRGLFDGMRSVSVDQLLFNGQEIYGALRDWGYNLDEVNYMTPEFCKRRAMTIRRLSRK